MGLREIKRAFALAVAACAAAMVLAGPAAAQSTSGIAGVWEFNGGRVGVVKNANKSFTGTVIRATTKGACVHPVGEQMWTNVRLAAGPINWSGKHVWFLTGPCRIAPATGNTAWKILKNTAGKTFLRGCYASWSRPDIQPMIQDSGEAIPAGGGPGGSCIDSDYIPRKKATFKRIARFPKSKCLGKTLKLKFVDPPTDALATVQVSAGKIKKKLTRAKLSLNLKVSSGAGQVKIKVLAKTLLGKKIKGGATYKTC